MSANQTPDYRPAFVTQRDGSSLANSNCRMASIAMGLDLETRGGSTSTGSRMRSYTDDQSGGTDSGDAKEAWSRGYSETLTVRDGGTFDDALADLRSWRAVHLDVWHAATGQECVSGSGAYGHTMIVLPDYNGDGWAVGDPWCTGGYGRIPESKLRKGAETWGTEVYGRAADEPDYPADAAGPRDPRVLAIVARIVRRLMSQSFPGGPPGELRHADTGGGSILYTVTHPLDQKDEVPTVRKVTMTGEPGSIAIIPNPDNKYLRLDNDKLYAYTFTAKSPAIPATIDPPLDAGDDEHTKGYLIGDLLAWIPAVNATFTPADAIPPDVDAALADRDAEWEAWLLDGSPSGGA